MNELTEEETKELKEKLKEQKYENIEGILVHKDKKIAVTPDVYISEIQNAKLLVDHDYTVYLLPENFAFKRTNEQGQNESFSTPDTLTNEDFLELKTTGKRIGRRVGEALLQSNNILIRIKEDISYPDAKKKIQKKIKNYEKENNTKVKNGKLFLYFEKSALFISAEINNGKINILPQTPSLSDFTESRPVSSNIAQSSDKSSVKKMVQNGNIYGFAYEGLYHLPKTEGRISVNHSQKGYANPWFIIFINCDWFQDMVKAKWQQIHDDDVLGKLTAQIDETSSKYASNFANNYKRWNNIGNNGSVGNELNSKAAACKTQKEAADYLKDWLTKRFTALDGLWLN